MCILPGGRRQKWASGLKTPAGKGLVQRQRNAQHVPRATPRTRNTVPFTYKRLPKAVRAVLLSAGQGKRLLPLTESLPKCMLPVGDKLLMEWQIDTLLDAGFERVCVVLGYAADQVEAQLRARYGRRVTPLFNPFYQVADNLASCWMARGEMDRPFFLINGDTLFHPRLLGDLIAAPDRPITVTVDVKVRYDDDDMKVRASGDRLLAIGKTLDAATVTGESIGMLRFNQEGAARFRGELDRVMRTADGVRQWFLAAIHGLARDGGVHVHSIAGYPWAEVDYPADLEAARTMTAEWESRVDAVAR